MYKVQQIIATGQYCSLLTCLLICSVQLPTSALLFMLSFVYKDLLIPHSKGTGMPLIHVNEVSLGQIFGIIVVSVSPDLQTLYIAVCQLSATESCEPRCQRKSKLVLH